MHGGTPCCGALRTAGLHFCDVSAKSSEPQAEPNLGHSTKLLACNFKDVKVPKDQEDLRKCSRLEKTKETRQLHPTCSAGLDPAPEIKDILQERTLWEQLLTSE